MPFTVSPWWTNRISFLLVSHAVAFSEGYHLISLGLDCLLPTVGISALLALLWVREYWSCPPD
jgi:hypothetical protein